MSEPPKLDLVPVEELQHIKGVAFPAHLKFRQLLVTGPPGSGKTQLINQVGGWPEEGGPVTSSWRNFRCAGKATPLMC